LIDKRDNLVSLFSRYDFCSFILYQKNLVFNKRRKIRILPILKKLHVKNYFAGTVTVYLIFPSISFLGCDKANVTVSSGDVLSQMYSVRNLLEYGGWEDHVDPNYWLGPGNSPATFILDLGCILSINEIYVINTHNAESRDRATRQFR
jgi:hypothetical protein